MAATFNPRGRASEGSIAGFVVWQQRSRLSEEAINRAVARALGHSPWLTQVDRTVGHSRVRLWGHGELETKVAVSADGGITFLAGRPHCVVGTDAMSAFRPRRDALPWEGRLVAVHLSADGSWALKNDWNGSLPVYYGDVGGPIAGTLEPAVRTGLGLTFEDATPTGIVSLLTHGYFLGSRTLFDAMHAMASDSLVTWDGTAFRSRSVRSIIPNDSRWGCGWEDLVSECADRTLAALEQAIETRHDWTLPLSSGLDSRLIALAAANLRMEPECLTFGQPGWLDPVLARRVARVLGFPWRFVNLGHDYLPRWTRYWADWFGSSMHFHGMYHMPLLATVGPAAAPTAVGYAGDPLGGAQTDLLAGGDRAVRDRFMAKWHMWKDAELSALLRFEPFEAIAELEAEFEMQAASYDVADYQKWWMIYQHNHTARFISYHPSLHDTWCGVVAPFVDRSLAEFTVSLPRAALDGRRLQIAALRKLHPRLATIAGSFSAEPPAPSGIHYLRRTIADIVPRSLVRGPLREFAPTGNFADQDGLRRHGKHAIWPLGEAASQLGESLDLEVVTGAEHRAAGGDLGAFARLQAVQPLAWLANGPVGEHTDA